MKTFDHMNLEEKLELLTAWVDGKVMSDYDGWQPLPRPIWGGSIPFRVKPAVQDSINWSHVHEAYKYMARDEDGEAYLYKDSPRNYESYWSSIGPKEEGAFSSYKEAGAFSSYKRGSTDWKDSLVCRP